MRRNYLKNILKGSEEMYLTDEEKDILSGARGESEERLTQAFTWMRTEKDRC